MAKWRIEMSPEVEDDLANIDSYTMKEWGLSQRDKYMGDMDEAILRLKDNPYISIDREYWGNGYRSITFRGEYHIIFRIDEKRRVIRLYRALHTKRDITRLMT